MKVNRNNTDSSKVISYETYYDKLYKSISEAINEDRFIGKFIEIIDDKVYITFKHKSRKGDIIISGIILSEYYKSTDCEDSYNLIAIGNDYLNKRNVDSFKEEIKEELKDSPAENMSELISKLDASYIDAFAKYKHNVLEDFIIDNLLRIGCTKDIVCAGNMEDIYHWLLYNYDISYSFSIVKEECIKGSYSKKLDIELIDSDHDYCVFYYDKEFTNENDYRSAYYTLNNFAINAACSYIYINKLERLS